LVERDLLFADAAGDHAAMEKCDECARLEQEPIR
jgi:hypothetical protein